MSLEQLKLALTEIYRSALEAADPEKAILGSVQRGSDELRIGEHSYNLRSLRKIFLVGTGKAGVPMARALEKVLSDRLEAGVIVVKYGHGGTLNKVQVQEAGHPEPDQSGARGAQQILRLLKEKLSSRDLLLVILSGGGSALLPAPVSEISLEQKKKATSVLLKCGATIHETNALRKHLSQIKGGRLIHHTQGAQVATLMLSDVVGDNPSSIASGPTAPDPTTFGDCLEIIRRHHIENELPEKVLEYLRAGAAGEKEETLKAGDPRFQVVQNLVVAGSINALRAAARKARSLGFSPLILSSSMYGNTEDAAKIHVSIAREVLSSSNPVRPPCCLISGGETTVKVTGRGKGGRNQEFTLCCAREIADWDTQAVLFASLGSDGTDGPTDAAGAYCSPETARRARLKGLSIDDHLEHNDSYHFFQELQDLIITGPTLTNVMDLRFVLMGGG